MTMMMMISRLALLGSMLLSLTAASRPLIRRSLIDDGPEKERPCLDSEGNVHVPLTDVGAFRGGDFAGGGFRKQRRTTSNGDYGLDDWDGDWENDNQRLDDAVYMDCEALNNSGTSSLGGDDPSSVETDESGFATNGTTVDLDILSIAPITITRSPTGIPTPSPMMTLTPAPTTPAPTLVIDPSIHYPPQFLDPSIRTVIVCQVSTALPPLRRRRLASGGGSYSSDSDDGHLSPSQENRLLNKVTEIIFKLIVQRTNFKVLRDFVHSRHLEFRERDVEEAQGPYFVLMHSKEWSNVTVKEVQPHEKVSWVMHNVAFWSIEDAENVTMIEEKMANVTAEAINSGEFLRELRRHSGFGQLVAVSVPGEESEAIEKAEDDLFDETFAVNAWDPSRWIGLVLFASTLCIIVSLNRTAQRRRQIVKEQQEWGVGLSTEDDINKLLTFGWEFEGSQVHAFDKSQLVYKDDDSMLIGDAVVPIPDEMTPTEAVTSSETRGAPTDGTPSGVGMSSATGNSSTQPGEENGASSGSL